MTNRSVSALLLSAFLMALLEPAGTLLPVVAQAARYDNDMSAPRPVSPEKGASAKSVDRDYEPDSLAQHNHEALRAFAEHKYYLAQNLLENVLTALEQEKDSELSVCEVLENLHLVLSAESKVSQADAVLQRAAELRKKFHLPPPSPRIVDILPNPAARKRGTEIVKEIVNIAEGHDPLFAPDKLTEKTSETWSALMVTGQHQRDTGDLKQALLSLRKALALANTFGRPNDKIVSSMNVLAGVYRHLDKPNSARILYLECINLHEKLGKTDSADYATLLDNAGQTLVELHEYPQAERVLEQAIQVYKKAQGTESSDLAMAMCNLGEVYLALKQDQKGEETIAGALAILRKALNPEDMRVLIAADNLAQVYSKHGKLKEAEELQRSIIATMEKVVGKTGVHPDLCLALNNLAQTLYQEKKFAEAEPLLKRCIDMTKRIYGDRSPKTLNSIAAYARFLEKTGRKEEADKLLKQVTAPG